MKLYRNKYKGKCLCCGNSVPAYVISAGDVTLYGDDVQCSGKSETLGVVSLKDEDTLLLKMNDYGIAHTF